MNAKPVQVAKPDIRTQWLQACEEAVAAQNHITIDLKKLDAVIADMQAVTDFSYWRSYVGPVDENNLDFCRLAYEMALTVGMIGGYITVDADNHAHKWHLHGSGSDAMFSVLAKLREKDALPDPSIGKVYDASLREQIAPVLHERGVPRPDYRLAVYEELGTAQAWKFFDTLMTKALKGDGFEFTCEHAQELSRAFPTSFGGDEPFHKKASLYFLFMSLALNQLEQSNKQQGMAAKVTTLVPSEYRLPQIFMAYNVIKPSASLLKTLREKKPLPRHSEEVRVLRQAAVVITEEIRKRTGLPLERVDGALYNMTKTDDFAKRSRKFPHMMVDTVQF